MEKEQKGQGQQEKQVKTALQPGFQHPGGGRVLQWRQFSLGRLGEVQVTGPRQQGAHRQEIPDRTGFGQPRGPEQEEGHPGQGHQGPRHLTGPDPLAQESPERRSIYVATGSFLAGLAPDPDIIGPQSIIEDLPAGPTGHITATDVDGWTLGAYHFTDGVTWVYLDCRSMEPPGDGWRSIAETFEFLPADE